MLNPRCRLLQCCTFFLFCSAVPEMRQCVQVISQKITSVLPDEDCAFVFALPNRMHFVCLVVCLQLANDKNGREKGAKGPLYCTARPVGRSVHRETKTIFAGFLLVCVDDFEGLNIPEHCTHCPSSVGHAALVIA